MKKLIAGMLIFLMGMTGAYAKSSGNFSSVIYDSGLDKNSIAISIKKLDTGKPVYELNEKILMHPASVQKLLTLPAAIDVLGETINGEFQLDEAKLHKAIAEYKVGSFLNAPGPVAQSHEKWN